MGSSYRPGNRVALRRTDLDEAALDAALDPFSMTEPNPNISASG